MSAIPSLASMIARFRRIERRARGHHRYWWVRGQIALGFCEPPEPISREGWGSGPWENEPDFERWQHKGLTCVAIRNRIGAWCGYVSVPKGHPWRACRYSEIDAEVHGGLTYLQQLGADHWVGFDCGHAWDLAPAQAALLRSLGLGPPGLFDHVLSVLRDPIYRDLPYVRANVAILAEQAVSAWPVD